MVKWIKDHRYSIWLVGFTILVMYSLWQNQQQTRDIQNSRVVSCQRTYAAFPEVFKPFFRPPKQQTNDEKKDQAKFYFTVRRLERSCKHQVKP